MLLKLNQLVGRSGRAVGIRSALLACAPWLLLGLAAGQATAPSSWTVQVAQPAAFSTSQMECSNFFSTGGYQHVMRLTGAENGLQITQRTAGDIIYLNDAAALHPGDEVRLMRISNPKPQTEQFQDQQGMLSSMGLQFESVGRAQILGVDANQVATARIDFSCQAAQVGDFAIPWQPRKSPPLPTSETINLLQSVSGRTQWVVAGRNMASVLGAGDELYLTGSAQQGARPGQRWLIFRRPDSPSTRRYRSAVQGVYSLMGTEPGLDINRLSALPHPPEIVGEVVVISAEAHGSTGIVTYARDTILPGDEAMIEQ